MMKKFFSMMLIAASLMAVSCDKDDDNDGDDNDTYVGTMTIAMTYNGNTLNTTQSDVTYLFEESNDSATVTLSEVKFTVGLANAINALGNPYFTMDEDPYMPSLDIVLPNIPETSDDVYEAATITPTTLYGDAYDTDTIKSITNVQVLDTDGAIYVSLDCELSITLVGDTKSDVTATITFAGAEAE